MRSELIVGILEIETRRGKKTDERENEWRERMNENIEEELVQCKKIKVNKVIQNIFMVSPKKCIKVDFIPNNCSRNRSEALKSRFLAL